MKSLAACMTVAALLLAACGGGGGGGNGNGNGAAAGTTGAASTGTAATGLASPGQADASVTLATGTLENHVLPVQGLYRQYSLFRPANPTHKKLPLVIWFHGAGGIVWPGIANDYWVGLAARENFYLLEPQAVNDQYQSYTYWNAGLGAPRDDIAFVKAALDSVAANADVDTDRVYIGGMSSGGHMAFYTAQMLRSQVAAVAPIAGSIATYPNVLGSYGLQRPLPLLNIHGSADTIVNINGGDWYASWFSIRELWLRNNKITTPATVIDLPDTNTADGTTVTKFEYRGPTPASDIDDYRINGGGHSVPGIESVANQDFNAYEVIWKFFKNHKLSDS